jgi:hypothetical protein
MLRDIGYLSRPILNYPKAHLIQKLVQIGTRAPYSGGGIGDDDGAPN